MPSGSHCARATGIGGCCGEYITGTARPAVAVTPSVRGRGLPHSQCAFPNHLHLDQPSLITSTTRSDGTQVLHVVNLTLSADFGTGIGPALVALGSEPTESLLSD